MSRPKLDKEQKAAVSRMVTDNVMLRLENAKLKCQMEKAMAIIEQLINDKYGIKPN